MCPEFGCLCPKKLEEQSEFHTKNGSRGGIIGAQILAKKKGKGLSAHMSAIGKLGGRGNTREKRLNEQS
jgi:hypothetical protein